MAIGGENCRPSEQINLKEPQKLITSKQVELGTIRGSACGHLAH